MNAIREFREKLGYSQENFATLLGVKQTAVSAYEMGARRPKLEVAKRMIDLSNRETSIYWYDIYPDIFSKHEFRGHFEQ